MDTCGGGYKDTQIYITDTQSVCFRQFQLYNRTCTNVYASLACNF